MFLFVLAFVPLALARPSDFTTTTTTQSPQAAYLGLAASADESLERTIDVGFTCAHRRLGYYADIKNDCRVFHICNPMSLPDGQQAIMQYSFFCPANSTFDQQALTCVQGTLNYPCHQAEKFYHVNDKLGVSPDLPEIQRHQHVAAPQRTVVPVQQTTVVPVQQTQDKQVYVSHQTPTFVPPAVQHTTYVPQQPQTFLPQQQAFVPEQQTTFQPTQHQTTFQPTQHQTTYQVPQKQATFQASQPFPNPAFDGVAQAAGVNVVRVG